ncbi:MAG: ATP-binding cassette domain-containing protein [Ignavibacteriales bacterium]|nr:ATP-binding cassette domain-containing protein [Ignavibacteriales bacterium]
MAAGHPDRPAPALRAGLSGGRFPQSRPRGSGQPLRPHARPAARPMSVPPLARVRGLARTYAVGDVRVAALEDVSLDIGEGRFVAVTGASGSGKSTLLNLLGGLDTPTAGTIEVGGVLVSEMDREALARYRRTVAGIDLPVLQPRPGPHGPGERRAAPRLRRRGAGREAAARGRAPRAGRPGPPGRRTVRPSSRAASSSAWPWPGPWPTGRACSWPTSRPATSTAPPRGRSSDCWPGSTAAAA